METNYITLTKENIANEHICCAFSELLRNLLSKNAKL